MVNVLSWNIAMCQPSAQAQWNVDENARRIRERILDANADVIAIQEAPTDTWGDACLPHYNHIGCVKTHCGFTIILVRTSIHATAFEVNDAPAVGVILNNTSYVSLHLAPSKGNEDIRLAQLESIVRSISTPEFVLIGDTNMRKHESASVEALDLDDAWKLLGSSKTTEYTWNSRINHYHTDGYQFTCRFDRAYVRAVTCTAFSLFANVPEADTDGVYLSDHFGIMLMIEPVIP